MSTIQTIGNTIKNGTKKLPYVTPSITQRGTRHVPEFLYHFTSEVNANEIIKTGKIIAKEEGSNLPFKGVFMVDLENFIKNWPKTIIDGGEHCSFNFFNALFSQVTKGNKRIACFRIPTNRLDKKMVIRDQSNLVEATEKLNFGEDVSTLISKVDDANLYKIYHEKGHAIEFINPRDIKINKEDLVGTAAIPEEMTINYVIGKKPLESAFDTLRYLFIKQPEEKILRGV